MVPRAHRDYGKHVCASRPLLFTTSLDKPFRLASTWCYFTEKRPTLENQWCPQSSLQRVTQKASRRRSGALRRTGKSTALENVRARTAAKRLGARRARPRSLVCCPASSRPHPSECLIKVSVLNPGPMLYIICYAWHRRCERARGRSVSTH